MQLNYDLLKELINIPSPTGFTKNAIAFLEKTCKNLGYKTYQNKKGNLIVEVLGEDNYVVGLSSHVDTLGLMVRSINNDGTIRFTRLGGPLLNTYNGEYCKIFTRGGKVYSGTVLSKSSSGHVYPDAAKLDLSEENMCVKLDEITYSKIDTEKLGIEVGNCIAIDPKFEITPSGYVKTRFLDDKASAFILLELLRFLKEEKITPKHSLKVIFTTYEEVGHGCSSIPYLDELLAVDMGCVGLDLTCTEEMVSICVKDSSGPYDEGMINDLLSLAKTNRIRYALDVYPMYGSDASAALRGGNDIKCALIGSGIANSHGMERTHKNGIENTFNLVKAYIL